MPDAFTALLDGPRARSAFVLRMRLDPPWAMRIQDESPLALVAVVQGEVHLVPSAGTPVHLSEGQVGIVRGPQPHVLADDPSTAPQIVVHPGQRCTTAAGEDLHDAMTMGVRTWGTGPDGATDLVVGVYEQVGTVGRRLLHALPDQLSVPASAVDPAVVALLARELEHERPGQSVVLDRVVDLLLVSVVRAWFDRAPDAAPSWYVAAQHPVVGQALQLVHENPAHPWTVAELASRVGVSRAAFARAFSALVEVPPMTYLTQWRLELAADLLREPDLTLDAVARRVGYGSGFALSSAFKRQFGISPAEHRAVARIDH